MSSPSDRDHDDRDDRAELDEEFSSVVPALRSLRDGDVTLERPPEAIWDRIEAELAHDGWAAPAPVTPMAPRRARAPRWLGLAAAAALLLVVGAAALLAAFGSGDDGDVVARADLATLDTEQVLGSAELVRRDGTLELDVDVPDDIEADGGYLELWLINDAVDGLVSLGPIEPGTAHVTLPAGIDTATFPIVDVSVEHFDGDPSHSGDSVVRGRLSV